MAEVFDDWGFKNHVIFYIKKLLKDPVNATPDDYLKANGWGNPKLLDTLCRNSVLTKIEKPGENAGKAIFTIQYKVGDNPEKKIQQIYDMHTNLNEDISGGATGADNSGQYTTTAFPIMRRTMYINEKQAERLKKRLLDEATTCGSVGNYAYDAAGFDTSKNPSFWSDTLNR